MCFLQDQTLSFSIDLHTDRAKMILASTGHEKERPERTTYALIHLKCRQSTCKIPNSHAALTPKGGSKWSVSQNVWPHINSN